jgi:hypothetical protein
MAIDRSIKVGIATSIVATALFIYFLDPILSLFGRTATQLVAHLYSGYIDHQFEQAALCSSFDAAFLLLAATCAAILSFSWGFCAAIVVNTLRLKRGLPPPTPILNLVHRRYLRTTLIVVAFVTALTLSMPPALWSGWFQLKVTSSFRQHMTALAPYLTDQEDKLIRSQWSQMRSRHDYDAIYSRLNDVAAKNNVKLPQNPVY